MRQSITPIKVRGYHIDLYQHVNNARYLEFLEEARWNHYEEALADGKFVREGLAFVIVNINISYRKPAFLGQTVEVVTAVKAIGGKSVTMGQVVRLAGTETVCAEADVTIVILDREGRPMVMEGDLRALLEA
jgi:thioesterase III